MTSELAGPAGPLTPYLVLILVGFLPSEVWRWLAVVFARNVGEGSPVLVWVRAVASALLAAVVARLLIAPSGALAAVPAIGRYGALAGGFAAYWLGGRSIFAGVLVGEALLVLAAWLR